MINIWKVSRLVDELSKLKDSKKRDGSGIKQINRLNYYNQ